MLLITLNKYDRFITLLTLLFNFKLIMLYDFTQFKKTSCMIAQAV